MPIIQENPTYFSDKSAVASTLNSTDFHKHTQSQRTGLGGRFGATRKNSVNSYDGTEDGSEMETFLSSCESNNSYSSSSENKNQPGSRNININSNGYSQGSLRKNRNANGLVLSPPDQNQPQPNHQQSKSGMSSLGRLGQLFKKSKSKLSVGSESHASTVESSGLGSPGCTPDSSLSIYTNSLDGDSHSSSNSNQISPKHLEESMEDRFWTSYALDDCDIFAANMYYNVGESSVFTIYHQNENNKRALPSASTSRRADTIPGSKSSQKQSYTGIGGRNDEFEDCVQPYYNNTTFSTFPNPKRCSLASAVSATTSSSVAGSGGGDGGAQSLPNEKKTLVTSVAGGKPTTHQPIQHDRDGYLRPNEARNLRNVKNLYINDSAVLANGNRNGQVQQVQVDVHTPTSSLSPVNNTNSFSEAFNSSAGSSANSGSRYQFDSAGSTTSAATTLVAGGSHNFRRGLPENETSNGSFGCRDDDDEDDGRGNRSNTNPLPVYMNRAYFGSNSIIPSSSGAHRRIAASVAVDCEPYCSLCASSIMGSPRQRSKMDVAIVKCKECFFSREAEAHIRGIFEKLMTKDNQKMDVTLKSYDLKDLDHPTDRVVVHNAKVQIVIISHHFLQRLKDEASKRPRLSPINRVFRSKTVIAVLMAVTEKEVLDGYESVLPRFREWFSVDLRSTNKYEPEFCKKFTEQVLRIYNVELSNSSNFSVFPKKVTREQPKIAIVFKKPVEENDEVRIELKTAVQVSIVSEVKMENPHTVLLRIPESLSPDREAIVDVSVFINRNKIGGSRIKSELNVRRVDEDDVDRMAKLLPPFLECLDEHISVILMRHYKECTDYTTDPALELMNGIIICKADILPTIMHFAAHYGLPKTAFTVLDEADGLSHCNIRNDLDETPSDIAFARGNSQIGQLIADYQEISNSFIAYRYIKELVEKDTVDSDNTDEIDNGHQEAVEETNQETGDAKSEDESLLEEQLLGAGALELLEAPKMKLIAKPVPSRDLSPSEACGSQGSLSEVGDSTKSEDDESEDIKTPKPRYFRRREYVNVDGNPLDNPELVQTREKRNPVSPNTAKKRNSIMQNYDVPRTRDQDYEVPPPDPRPVPPPKAELPLPVFKSKTVGTHVTSSGYLIMNEGVGTLSECSTEEPTVEEPLNTNDIVITKPPVSSSKGKNEPRKVSVHENPLRRGSNPENNRKISNNTTPFLNGNACGINHTNNNSSEVTAPLDPADEQLIELMNYFKNNTYDMHMVELLFESWKQRPDVQQSIEEKMKMLEKLREDYRKNSKGGKKPSAILDRIKGALSIKKKKDRIVSKESLPVQRTNSDSSTNGFSVVSPTGLSFTGPTLPTQPFNSSPSSGSTSSSPKPSRFVEPLLPSPVSNQPPRLASESSYRTSYDSRFSDSSTDSERHSCDPTSASGKDFHQSISPPKYKNPMDKRFIPSYVCPNPLPPTLPEVEEKQSLATPPPSNVSYEVPPPPRPFKPSRKPAIDIPIPEDSSISIEVVAALKPPVIPAKSRPALIDQDCGPPPIIPPRPAASANLFSYIDYKRKNQETNDSKDTDSMKKSYENMENEGDASK
ncbi:unnamed protein product [Orchesella dallaii]|uniref:DBB domain-containing protein n=1 Tax=Orchesella dallaii TaxID=48710 RepID=A0ABP1QL16_9HEXA